MRSVSGIVNSEEYIMKPLRYAVFGTGFWSQFQIAAWNEVGGVELVAVYNRTVERAQRIADRFGVPAVYGDAEALLDKEKLDFIDIITDVDTHSRFTHMAIERKIPVICQKPMAPTYEIAEGMVTAAKTAGVPFMIHENFRWQRPMRQVKRLLQEGEIGKPFRGRLFFNTSFPVFDNQPFLRELEQFILTDVGSHVLDCTRFLFGEAKNLYCKTKHVNQTIKGEDVASVFMEMGENNTIVTCEMSYASALENERFPQVFALIECENGVIELDTDYWVRVTTKGQGTHAQRFAPRHYPWADAEYDIVHSSIVDCNADLLKSLQTGQPAETNGADNLETVRLVFASYESAATGRVITF